MTGSQLSPCPTCSRHLRQTERACPFCGAALHAAFQSAAAPATSRVARSALFALGATSVAAVAGCGAVDVPPVIRPDSSISDASGAAVGVMDGGPPTFDDAASDAGPSDAPAPPVDSGNPLPPYGAPPFDAGGSD